MEIGFIPNTFKPHFPTDAFRQSSPFLPCSAVHARSGIVSAGPAPPDGLLGFRSRRGQQRRRRYAASRSQAFDFPLRVARPRLYNVRVRRRREILPSPHSRSQLCSPPSTMTPSLTSIGSSTLVAAMAIRSASPACALHAQKSTAPARWIPQACSSAAMAATNSVAGPGPRPQWLESGDALLPSGCAALYRRELLDDVGLFDEDFFLYCEDTDLGLRAVWAGWRLPVCGRRRCAAPLLAFRRGLSPSSRPNSWSGTASGSPSRISPPPGWCSFPSPLPFAISGSCSAIRHQRGTASGFVRSGNTLGNIAAILAGAWWETIVGLPGLLRKRSLCRARHRISPTQFRRAIGTNRISLKDLAYSG